MEISKIIREKIIEKNVSLEELSIRSCISKSQIENIIRGKSNPRMFTVQSILDSLDSCLQVVSISDDCDFEDIYRVDMSDDYSDKKPTAISEYSTQKLRKEIYEYIQDANREMLIVFCEIVHSVSN